MINKLRKGKHFLMMHPETAEESPLEILTSKCVEKGEVHIIRGDQMELRPSGPLTGMVHSVFGVPFMKKGPVEKAESV